MLILGHLVVGVGLQAAVADVASFDVCMASAHCRSSSLSFIVPFFVFKSLLFV